MLSFKDFMVVDYLPGMPDLVSYQAHKRKRGRIGESVELEEQSMTDDDWVVVAKGRKPVRFLKNPKNNKAPRNWQKSSDETEVIRVSKAKQMGIIKKESVEEGSSAQSRLDRRAAKHGLGKKSDRLKKASDFFSKPPPKPPSKDELRKMGHPVESVSEDAKFDAWYKKSLELDKMSKDASAKLKKFPKGNMGLTPDSVRKDPQYKKAKAQVDSIFRATQQHNKSASNDWKRKARDRRRGVKEDVSFSTAVKKKPVSQMTPAEKEKDAKRRKAYKDFQKGMRKGFKSLRASCKNEDVNELSKGTMSSYAKKASGDAQDERDYAQLSLKHAQNAPSQTVKNARLRSAQRANAKADQRSKGVALAKKKLGESKSASGYDLYHKTFSGAMQHAYAWAKKQGVTVSDDDIDNKVAIGPAKPKSGKTNSYILSTDKKNRRLHVQVANLDNRRYELNAYIQ